MLTAGDSRKGGPPCHSQLCPANRAVALTWSQAGGPCPSVFSNHVPDALEVQSGPRSHSGQASTQFTSKLQHQPGPSQVPHPGPLHALGQPIHRSHTCRVAICYCVHLPMRLQVPGGQGCVLCCPESLRQPVCRRRSPLYPPVCCPSAEWRPGCPRPFAWELRSPRHPRKSHAPCSAGLGPGASGVTL